MCRHGLVLSVLLLLGFSKGLGNNPDSLYQVMYATSDSLRSEVYMGLTRHYWEASRTDSTLLDSVLAYSRMTIQKATRANDTLNWIDGISYLRAYYGEKNIRSKADSLQKQYKFLLGKYGFTLPGNFNYRHDEAGYRYGPIYNTLQIYQDPRGNLSIEDVSAPAFRDSFTVNSTNAFNLHKDAWYWVKLRLKGNPERDNSYLFMLGINEHSWNEGEIYLPDGDGFEKLLTGFQVPPEEKALDDWRNLFEVFVPRNGDLTIYLRLRRPTTPQRMGGIYVNHMDREYMTRAERVNAHQGGIFQGIVWIQAFYFFLLFLSARVRSYLFYVIYIVGLGLIIGVSNYFNLLFPAWGLYKFPMGFLAFFLVAFGIIRFSEVFLEVRERLPAWKYSGNYLLAIFSLVGVITIALKSFDLPWMTPENQMFWRQVDDKFLDMFILVNILGLILMMVWGFLIMKKGFQPARYFLIAQAFLAAGFIIPGVSRVFRVFSWMDFNTAIFSVQLGIVLQLSFFALGVGFKRRQLELDRQDALKEANDKLREADKLKDEFLANTSHELRTPLNGIIGIAEALTAGVAGNPNPEMKENLQMIVGSGKRLASLVNDILDFSKLKSRDLTLQLKPIDIRSVAQVILTLSEPMKAGKKLDLINEIPDYLPSVLADENRLQQILYNLVGNAIKFTGEGSVVVSAEQKGKFLEVSVTDTGVGIPQDKHETIFMSFEQADGSTEREYGGTGLGLSITQKLVELHGGKIGLESSPGNGSRFFFTLPVSGDTVAGIEKSETLVRPVANVEATVLTQKDHESGFLNGNRKQISILVVDDEPINQQVLKNHLAASYYDVTAALNGEEALRYIHSDKKFDLVLLDLMMPRMSGYEVCQEIRKKYLPSELPVIMITARNQVNDLVEGLAIGANDYISKPFSRQEFLARISTHLNLFNINSAYGRFVPMEFLRSLGHQSILDVNLGDQIEKEVTVFFSDIRSYTTLSEKMTPRENFNFLNAYLGRVGPIIRNHHGFVSQYLGDGIMAIFQNHPADALTASVEMFSALEEYNEDRISKGRTPIKIGIGLHTGPLMMGVIGDRDRMDAGVVADAVNTASRLEGLTKYFGASIIMSERTLSGIQDKSAVRYRYLGKVQVKGKQEPLEIYDVFEGDESVSRDLKFQTRGSFEAGLKKYYEAAFPEAVQAFDQVLKINPEDTAARYFHERATEWMNRELPSDWDGVVMMMSK